MKIFRKNLHFLFSKLIPVENELSRGGVVVLTLLGPQSFQSNKARDFSPAIQ